MAEKSLFLSKTFWFSLVSGLVVALVPALPVLAPVKDWLASNSLFVSGCWTILAVALRAITKDKIVLRE